MKILKRWWLPWLLLYAFAAAMILFVVLQPKPPPTPAELAQAAAQEAQEAEWQVCAATWSPLERRVWDGISYAHESAIIRLSHIKPAGCAVGLGLLHSLAAYPADRRDDTFDLATSP